VAVSYLQQLEELYPQNIRIKLELARQLFGVGQINSAYALIKPFLGYQPQTADDWRAQLLNYQIQKNITFAVEPSNKQARRNEEKKLFELSKQFTNAPISNLDFLQLSLDAIYLDEIPQAKQFYQRVSFNRNFKLADTILAAQIGLALGNYKKSAAFYFKAQQLAENYDEKKRYYLSALRTLQQGNYLNEALYAAQANIGEFRQDKDVLTFLTGLALASNRPDLAQKYVKQALELQKK
ncbi:MAG: hypothetical protein AAGG80_06345, partial [Pseudomonadota bacterium]